MFDFSEISLNSNLTNDNNDYLLDFNNNSFSEIFLNKKDQDFTFILFPRNKLFEEEIHFKNFDLNYSNKDKENQEKRNVKYKTIKFEVVNEIQKKDNIHTNFVYRKDAYYKHFKSLFAKYIKIKANKLKNLCFPNFSQNNFSALSYLYTGNPKEKDNYNFLFFKIKDLLILGKNKTIHNRQYNNELLIKYIEKNEKKAKDKKLYSELITFMNSSIEDELITFYNDNKEFENINKDIKCQFFDKNFKDETGISILEKYGFVKILKRLEK